MSRWITNLGASALTLVLTASSALAIGPGGGPTGGGGTGGGGGGGGVVPEFDVGVAASALTLLVGFTLIALDRYRRARRVAPAA